MASSHDAHGSHSSTAAHDVHDAHGATAAHGDDHGAERPGWVLIPLVVAAVLAVVILALIGVRSDVPESTTPIGAEESDVERREAGMVGEGEHGAETADHGEGAGSDGGEGHSEDAEAEGDAGH